MGSAFPEPPFSCTVHSVFDTALNLSTGGNDPLVTLIADEAYLHPLSALVYGTNRENRVHFDELALVRGMRARPENGFLVFENGLKVRAASAGTVSAERIAVENESPPAFSAPAADLLAKRGLTLEKRQADADTLLRRSFLYTTAGADATFRMRFTGAAHDTARFLQADNPDRSVQSALGLVGLGPGLTPSGDDFLCGFMLAAWIRTNARWGETGQLSTAAVQSFIDGLLEAADGPKPLTSDVSLSFLRLAKRRLFSRSLVALARSFLPGSNDDIFNDALAALGRLGHSSGLDSATGFLFGLDPAASR